MSAKPIKVDFIDTPKPRKPKPKHVPLTKGGKPRFTPAVMHTVQETPPVVIPDVRRMKVLQAALAYAEAGIYVLPVKRGAKHPGSLVGDAWEDKASIDPAVITAWWKKWPSANVGICPGKSGLVAFDLDKTDNLEHLPADIAGELRKAAYQRSRDDDRGHYLFTDSIGFGNTAGGWRTWGDVRGVGGFLMAAPSVHPETEKRYQWVRPGTVPPMPALLRELVGTSALQTQEPLTADQLEGFLDEYDQGRDTNALDKMVGAFHERAIDDGEARHTSMTGILVGALRDAREGKYPARLAYDTLEAAYLETFNVVGSRKPYPGEFREMAQWAATQLGPEELAAGLWEMTPELQAIHEAAVHWGVTPMALLGQCLLRVAASIPPSHYLPGIVGGAPASLNLFLLVVGHTGQGKNNAERLAARILPYDDATQDDVRDGTPASGEGLAAMFDKRTKPKGKADTEDDALPTGYRFTRVAARFGEISALEAAVKRNSSTLGSYMLEMWTGAGIGGKRGDGTGHDIKVNRYRLVISVNGQPTELDVVLTGRGQGLPQRFIWVTTEDPHAVEPQATSDDVPPVIGLPSWPFDRDQWGARMGTHVRPSEAHEFTIPDEVRRQVQAINPQQRRLLLEDPASTESHRLLMMEKVALTFAVLHGKTKGFTMEHWEMAERLIRTSDALYTRMRVFKAKARKQAEIKKALQEADLEVASSERKAEKFLAAAKKSIVTKLTALAAGKTLTAGELRSKLTANHQPHTDVALDELRREGIVGVRRRESGHPGYFLKERG
ncbi:hypothetical protein GCM10009775_30560 [Microbacterium aoyamense]|uniref:DNA primase/polymerase bifunctional N-terminal domain-containing protein n=1 Tax=Microbacterium aoyamense TaxID=344166 RepID=A0ABN2PZU0_9MICO